MPCTAIWLAQLAARVMVLHWNAVLEVTEEQEDFG
jgi:hypothetical protein